MPRTHLEDENKKAVVYRMVTDKHICPFGIKAVDLLKRKGFEVEDNWLTNRADTDAFKEKHDVKTTPQTFIGDERIGGYDDLRQHFGYTLKNPDKKTYTPVLIVFYISSLLALAASWTTLGELLTLRSLEWFVAFAMGMLAMLKLRDLETFSTCLLVMTFWRGAWSAMRMLILSPKPLPQFSWWLAVYSD